MIKYIKRSRQRLNTCCPEIIEICEEVIKYVVLLGVLAMLSGCVTAQSVRDQMASWAESDVKNVEAMKQVSTTLKQTWPFYSGVLDGVSDKLSGEVMGMKASLDKLYATGPWDDKAMGQALTLRTRLVYELGDQALDEILPGLTKILAPLL
jgi:hypothetical protein